MLLPPAELPEFFGQIDIYLFDQLLKGRLTPGMLDAVLRRALVVASA